MKVLCDCGAVHSFSDFDEDMQQHYEYDDCIGATYNTIRGVTFWQPDHKALGIMCHNCEKAIWIFM